MSEIQVRNELASIRATWSQEEHEKRINLAKTKQLQLRQLVVLSELMRPAKESEAIASAC